MGAEAQYKQNIIAAIFLCGWFLFSNFIVLQMFIAVINEVGDHRFLFAVLALNHLYRISRLRRNKNASNKSKLLFIEPKHHRPTPAGLTV